MKKMFDFSWLNFLSFQPRRRRARPTYGRLETLQQRTVPAAISGMTADDATVDEATETDNTETSTDGGDSSSTDDSDVVTEESGDEIVPVKFMYFANMASTEVDGEESSDTELTDETSEDETSSDDGSTNEESTDDFVVPMKFNLFSTATADDGEESTDETVADDGSTDSGSTDDSSSEEKSSSDETTDDVVTEDTTITDAGTKVDPRYYFRTLSSSSSEDGSGEDTGTDGTEEPVLFKGEDTGSDTSTDPEVINDPQIYYMTGIPGDPVEGEPVALEDTTGTDEGNPDVIFYSTAGGGTEDTGEEVAPTSAEEDNPEIRTLSGGIEVTTFQGVVELGMQEFTSATESFQSDLQSHIGNFTQLVGLINAGLAQNAQDIAAFAAAGDTAGIQAEIAQNQVLIQQLTQLVSDYVSGIIELQQTFVGRISSASQAISQAAANPNDISGAAATFTQSRLAIRPVFTNDLSARFVEFQDLIDSQAGGDEGDQGFAPGELDPTGGDVSTGLRIRQGNTSATASISEIGASLNLTGDIENVAQPAVGQTVTVNVSLTNTDDTLGDEPVFVGSVTGTVDLTGTDDGADITGGKLTIEGVKGDEPFSIDVNVPGEVDDEASFDENGLLSGLSGQYVLPATEGLLPDGGTLVVSVTITPTAT